MIALRPDDLSRCISRLPAKLGKAVVDRPGHVAVAGGYIRGTIARERPSDIDVYVRDDETAEGMLEGLGSPRHKTPYATTVVVSGRPVQIITRWLFTDPVRLVREFDFTVCQAALWYTEDGWNSLASDDFYADLAARRIRYAHPGPVREAIEAGGTLMRLMKYTSRGYSAAPETLAQIAHAAVIAAGDERALLDALRGIDPVAWPEWAREAVIGGR